MFYKNTFVIFYSKNQKKSYIVESYFRTWIILNHIITRKIFAIVSFSYLLENPKHYWHIMHAKMFQNWKNELDFKNFK